MVLEVEEIKVFYMENEKIVELVNFVDTVDEIDFQKDKVEKEKIIVYFEEKVGSINDNDKNNEVNKNSMDVEKVLHIDIIIDYLDYEEHWIHIIYNNKKEEIILMRIKVY